MKLAHKYRGGGSQVSFFKYFVLAIAQLVV